MQTMAASFPRLLCPARPLLDEVDAILAALPRARGDDAWSALASAGCLPPTLPAGSRLFRAAAGTSRPPREIPPNREAVRAFVSALPVALACETLALAIAERLVAWGGVPPSGHFVWTILAEGKPRQSDLRTLPHPSEAMLLAQNAAQNLAGSHTAWPAGDALRLSSLPRKDAAQHVFVRDLAAHEAWQRAVSAGAVVRLWDTPRIRRNDGSYRSLVVPPATLGRRFAVLGSPFEPLVAIWAQGCVLEGIGDDGHLRLTMPAVARLDR